MPTFTSSRISALDNLIFPDRIIIDETKVIYHKRALIGYESITIMRASIASVHVECHLFFADLIIETNGGRRTIINGLTRADARAAAAQLSN